tara:strand:- start:32 stop:745 length:714 start_codon:yes stop_codon:yes gene_type:complete
MILITRPEEEAIKLKKILKKQGLQCHIDSLSKIENVLTKVKFDVDGIAMLTSLRATKIFVKKYNKSKNTPLIIIGLNSYKKAVDSGFSNIIFFGEHSNEVYKFLKKNVKKNKPQKIIYFTSTVINEHFILKIKELGYQVNSRVVYKTNFKQRLKPLTVQLIKKNKLKVCLIYSQQNANHFCKLINSHGLYDYSKKIIFVTISKMVSQILKKNGYKRVRTAAKPNQKSVVKKLMLELL